MKKFFFPLCVAAVTAFSVSCTNRTDLVEPTQKKFVVNANVIAHDVWRTNTRADSETDPTFHIYFFNPNDEFIARRGNAMSDQMSIRIEIDETIGKHTAYCITGWAKSEYTNPNAGALVDAITHTIPSAKDICLGKTEFETTEDNLNYNITITVDHIMAKLALNVKNVPSDILSLTATLPNQANTFGFDGTLTGNSASQELTLTKSSTANDDGTYNWTLAETIVFPSATGTTSMPIKIVAKDSSIKYTFSTSSSTCCLSGSVSDLTAEWGMIKSQVYNTVVVNSWTNTVNQGNLGTLTNPDKVSL